jgi:hypothetical protein
LARARVARGGELASVAGVARRQSPALSDPDHPMKIFAAAALAVLLIGPAPAFAKSYTLPDDNAIAVVTIPDAWDTEEIDDGVESTSPDENVYVAVEVVDAENIEAGVKAALKYLIDNKVEIDPATEKRQQGKINDMDAITLGYSGKDEDGPTNVSVSVIVVSDKKMLLLTYWGTPDGEKANAEDLGKILMSIKKVAN